MTRESTAGDEKVTVHARQAFHVVDAGGYHRHAAVGNAADAAAVRAGDAHVEHTVRRGGDPPGLVQAGRDHGQAARLEAQDASQGLFDDEHATVAVDGKAGGPI